MAIPDRPAPGADAYPSPAAQAAALHAFLAVKNPRVSPRLSEDAIAALAPKQLEPVKTLARRLRPVLAQLGVRMKHTPALEAAARIQGQSSWHETPTEFRAPPHTFGAVLGSPFPGARGDCAVEKPEVAEVLDRSTGLFERHCDVIGDDWPAAMELRMEVQTNLDVNPRFLCSQCFTPVYLVSRHDAKKLFFRHTLEDGRCAAVNQALANGCIERIKSMAISSCEIAIHAPATNLCPVQRHPHGSLPRESAACCQIKPRNCS